MNIIHTDEDTRHPWPEGTYVQGGGDGAVYTRTGSYHTAFCEAFPDDTFIRGEGSTIAQAEDDAWAQYEKLRACPGHEYESRGYMNGSGFCKHCGRFQTGVFTPEQLGCYCVVCGTPTFWSRIGGKSYCPLHATDPDTLWLKQRHLHLHVHSADPEFADLLTYLSSGEGNPMGGQQ